VLLLDLITSVSFSAENEYLFSFLFRFRTENDLPFSAPVSFMAENVKSIFGRSLAMTLKFLPDIKFMIELNMELRLIPVQPFWHSVFTEQYVAGLVRGSCTPDDDTLMA